MWSHEPLLFLPIALHRMSSLLITNNYRKTNPVMLRVVIIFYSFHCKITNRTICMILFVFANNIPLRAQSLLTFYISQHHKESNLVLVSLYIIYLSFLNCYSVSCIWWSPFTAFNLRTVSLPFAMTVYSVCSFPFLVMDQTL